MTLKEFRKSQNLTQAQAGEALGITKQRFGQIEKAWPEVDHNTIWALAEKLGAIVHIERNKGWEILGYAPATINEEE